MRPKKKKLINKYQNIRDFSFNVFVPKSEVIEKCEMSLNAAYYWTGIDNILNSIQSAVCN